MKNLFKEWKLFDICFLTFSILIIIFCFLLIPNKNISSLIVSILGIITVISGAKGLIISPFINIIYNIIYIIICFSQKFYGEVIIYSFILTPLNIITINSWFKNRSKENKNIVKVNKLSIKEYFILGILTILITICFYFLLKSLNTKSLLISTLSLTDSFVATYLLFRRCSNYALAYIVNDIILITLWFSTINTEKTAHLPIIISFIIFLINDIYGLTLWKKREKIQNTKTDN